MTEQEAFLRGFNNRKLAATPEELSLFGGGPAAVPGAPGAPGIATGGMARRLGGAVGNAVGQAASTFNPVARATRQVAPLIQHSLQKLRR